MSSTNIDEKLLEGLSLEERDAVLKMMKEFSSSGESKTYNDLLYADWKEIPVDIETFLTDDNYLGKAWKDINGVSKIYPFWMKTLKDIFPNNLDTNYEALLESGARGIGKSEVACGGICPYLMYRVMCLKNPLEYYHIKLTEKIAFAFMNIKLDLAEAIATDKFQKTIQMSPWFMPKGTMTQRNNKPYWNPPDPIEIIIGSQSDDVIGRPIFFAFFDEISFLKNKDIEEQKKKATDMIDTAIGGMKTRFIHKGKNPTLLVVASSKRSEQSFMESYIRLLSETSSNNTLIVDKPVWEVKPEGTYSKDKFYIGLGNKFLDSIVIPDSDKDNLMSYSERGYQVIEAPIDFKENALKDLERMLCDYAGISSFSSNKFMSAERVADTLDNNIQNPMPDVIEVGNAKDDLVEYENFFDMNKVPKEYMDRPMFIHLDMSISGDKTGICAVWIIGKKPTTSGDGGNDLFFQVAFSTSVEAPKGRQISFEKNRNFIRWLRDKGFLIKEITSDTFQSYDLQQQLSAEGFNCSILSVDRVESVPGEHVGICRPYQYLKNTIYEGRIKLHRLEKDRNELLYNELIQLEKNNNTGKVDHPPKGCFTGNTKVRLVDGRSLTFLELVDEYNKGITNYVYSINLETQQIEAKEISKAWKTLDNQPLVRITLDNGEYVECTLNHRFMLRNGEYVDACELLPGDSLMPLYTKTSQKGLQGYRMYYEPFENTWHFEHRRFARDVLDEKYLVHHKDCNKLNNNPSNLVWCSKEMHQSIHSKLQTGAQSEESNKKRSASVKRWHKKNKDTDVYVIRSKNISKAVNKYNKDVLGCDVEKKLQEKEKHIKEIENTFNVNYNELTKTEKNSLGVKLHRINHQEVIERIAQKVSKNHKLGKYTNAKNSLKEYDNKCKALKQLFPKIDENLFNELFNIEWSSLSKSLKGVWSNRYRQKLYELRNHKVIKLEFISKREDVYDIEVADNHNFALDCGVFVHNSKDQADALCGATFTASKYAEEYAYRYGENLQDIVELNDKLDADYEVDLAFTKAFEQELLNSRLAPKVGKPDEDVKENEDSDWMNMIL